MYMTTPSNEAYQLIETLYDYSIISKNEEYVLFLIDFLLYEAYQNDYITFTLSDTQEAKYSELESLSVAELENYIIENDDELKVYYYYVLVSILYELSYYI